MLDTDDTPEPVTEATAAAASGEPASPPAEAVETTPTPAKEPERLSLTEIVGKAIDQAEKTASPADEGASPAPTEGESEKDAGEPDAPDAAAAAEAPKDKPAEQGAEAAEDGELTPAELAALPKKTQRRIRQLIEQRGRFKESHEAYGNITSYMAENRLSGEEVAVGFDLMAKLKRGDAAGFLKAIEPYVRNARLAAGEELPDDIRQRVDAGYVDEDTAKELARERARAAAAASVVKDRDARDQAVQAASFSAALRDTLNSWDRTNASDPDFAAVRPALLEFAKVSFAAQPPRTADEAVKRLNDHWHLIRRRAPTPPRSSPPSPSSQQSTGRTMVREPKSLLDAIDIGIERAMQRGGATAAF